MQDLLLLEPFLVRALIAGIGIAIVVGVLGCFVVWRRMAYFGDSLAHSALLGVALGMLAGVSVNIGIVFVCAVFAGSLVWLQQQRWLATDTLLGILAHSALSVGMVAISFLDAPRFDVQAYLFGDLLSVHWSDIIWIYAGGAVVVGLIVANWPSLVLMTIHEDLARAEGVRPVLMQLLLMLMMTLVVAISVRMVGMLLITSLLIIPAATARQLVRSPEAMALLAAILGMVAVGIGMAASLSLDTPTGPTIVSASAAMFALLLPLSRVFSRPS